MKVPCILFLSFFLFHFTCYAVSNSLADSKYAVQLKSAKLEIVLNPNMDDNKRNEIETVISKYWNYCSYTFISFDDFKTGRKEKGHFYLVGTRFNAFTSYMTYGSAKYIAFNYNQNSADSISEFVIITSDYEAISPINTIILSPNFKSRTIIDPLNLIIMQDYLNAVWDNKEKLETTNTSLFSNNDVLSIINNGAKQLKDKKLLLMFYPEIDTERTSISGTLYNSAYARSHYTAGKVGFIDASKINFENLSALSGSENPAVFISLIPNQILNKSRSILPRPTIVYDIKSQHIIAYMLSRSVYVVYDDDLENLSKIASQN